MDATELKGQMARIRDRIRVAEDAQTRALDGLDCADSELQMVRTYSANQLRRAIQALQSALALAETFGKGSGNGE